MRSLYPCAQPRTSENRRRRCSRISLSWARSASEKEGSMFTRSMISSTVNRRSVPPISGLMRKRARGASNERERLREDELISVTGTYPFRSGVTNSGTTSTPTGARRGSSNGTTQRGLSPTAAAGARQYTVLRPHAGTVTGSGAKAMGEASFSNAARRAAVGSSAVGVSSSMHSKACVSRVCTPTCDTQVK